MDETESSVITKKNTPISNIAFSISIFLIILIGIIYVIDLIFNTFILNNVFQELEKLSDANNRENISNIVKFILILFVLTVLLFSAIMVSNRNNALSQGTQLMLNLSFLPIKIGGFSMYKFIEHFWEVNLLAPISIFWFIWTVIQKNKNSSFVEWANKYIISLILVFVSLIYSGIYVFNKPVFEKIPNFITLMLQGKVFILVILLSLFLFVYYKRSNKSNQGEWINKKNAGLAGIRGKDNVIGNPNIMEKYPKNLFNLNLNKHVQVNTAENFDFVWLLIGFIIVSFYLFIILKT